MDGIFPLGRGEGRGAASRHVELSTTFGISSLPASACLAVESTT